MRLPVAPRALRSGALLLAAALLAAACSSGASPSGSGSDSPGPATPAGPRTFLSVAATGVELVPGTRVRITLDGDRLGADAGCNSMSGRFVLVGGLLAFPDGLATTEMGCDAPRHAQDAWLASFLEGAALALAGDTLVLEQGGVRLTLSDREVVEPDRPLEGTRWVLDTILVGDTASSVPAGVEAWLRMEGGTMTLHTGCNQGGGRYRDAGGMLVLDELVLTEMACPGNAGAVEAAVTAVVGAFPEVGWSIDADRLTLTAGGRGLGFRASP